MAGAQDYRLAAAVTKAGGMGSLPAGMLSPEALEHQLQVLSEQVGTHFNINFFCHTSPQPDAHREQQWRTRLSPYFQELGINPDTIADGPQRRPFSHESADIVERFRPDIVSFHFGLPEPALLERVKAWGSKVIASATTVAEARWLEQHGVDAVIAQGLEAGGHRGMFLTDDLGTQKATFELLPEVLAAVDVPVIAAGGIRGAKSVKRALDRGACAVQPGSAWLLCPESTISPVFRNILQSSSQQVTAVTNLFSGRPARGIINRVMEDIGPISSDTPEFPLASTAITALRQKAESQGNGDFSPLWCGECVSDESGESRERDGALQSLPAADVVKALMAE